MGGGKRQKKSKKIQKTSRLMAALKLEEASADPRGYDAQSKMEEIEGPKTPRRVRRVCDGCHAYEGCFVFRACGLCQDVAKDGEVYGIRFRKR